MNANLKKRLKARRDAADTGDEPEFQVAPMADVLFVLLVFFMSITTSEIRKKEAGLELPNADDALDISRHDVVINVRWNLSSNTPAFTIDSQEMSLPGVTQLLSQRKQANENMSVQIRADQNVYYDNISELMQACAQAGIGNVTFAVISGGGKDGA